MNLTETGTFPIGCAADRRVILAFFGSRSSPTRVAHCSMMAEDSVTMLQWIDRVSSAVWALLFVLTTGMTVAGDSKSARV